MRRSWSRLIFVIGMPIQLGRHLCIEQRPPPPPPPQVISWNSAHSWVLSKFSCIIFMISLSLINQNYSIAKKNPANLKDFCATDCGILTPDGVMHLCQNHMMTSSDGNIFRVTGHLCGEFTGDRWIPSTKASDAELWCFLWSAPE